VPLRLGLAGRQREPGRVGLVAVHLRQQRARSQARRAMQGRCPGARTQGRAPSCAAWPAWAACRCPPPLGDPYPPWAGAARRSSGNRQAATGPARAPPALPARASPRW
jgi:hypothetical protein